MCWNNSHTTATTAGAGTTAVQVEQAPAQPSPRTRLEQARHAWRTWPAGPRLAVGLGLSASAAGLAWLLMYGLYLLVAALPLF